ncbi:MAG TPA: aminotransferase class V-fold PLP-dependent enzyme [Thermoanaerobaculia bacterium]|nr:aminotransferase class V-fold PLP-dependent enzyme [Thermoanaerobaculia bacterium]
MDSPTTVAPAAAVAPSRRPSTARAGVAAGAWGGRAALHPELLATAAIDRLRALELSRLDEQGQVYLDYTGGGLHAACQVRRHAALLLAEVLGNPHSASPSSRRATDLVERARRRVLEHFRASADEYLVVFTANASHALKLVGESYPFGPGDELLLTFDNHNSVNGIREYDRVRGARTTYVPLDPEMRVDDAVLERHLATPSAARHRLFAYPAQSNFSGVQHPLEWIERARGHGWDVLVDAAAFVPTNRLDLSRWRPDFVALSFYKMFGYPTGVGALLGRREALARLHRPWFAGGTIAVASVQADRHVPATGAAAFEDGTASYATIPAVEIGLDLLESVGIETVQRRVRFLTGWLLERLLALEHGNGRPLVTLYGPPGSERRGGTLALNFRDRQGRVVDHRLVEELAARRRISLRTGCFCNPGAGEAALGLVREELEACFSGADGGLTYEEFRRCIEGKGSGAVRVSFGLGSNLADAEAFLALAESLREA